MTIPPPRLKSLPVLFWLPDRRSHSPWGLLGVVGGLSTPTADPEATMPGTPPLEKETPPPR
eukprot:484723-Prorocentrum_minimum.AAC.1